MFAKQWIHSTAYDWKSFLPIFRYLLGVLTVLVTVTLLDYPLSYLAVILSLSFMAPGAKPLAVKQAFGFILILSLVTGSTFVFSAFFKTYPLVFLPLLSLAVLWTYYARKLPMSIKLFVLISLLIIPLMSLENSSLGGFIGISLVFNTLIAICITQFMFMLIPYASADARFEKEKKQQIALDDVQQFRYAFHILLVLLPLILLFFIFQYSGGALILIFASILSISPQLSNPKVGLVMIVANILGGVIAILCYQLLTVVPVFAFMLCLIVMVGLLFGQRLFSSRKTASIFGTAFSTFLLILCSVTSSDAEAGAKVWDRVLQISMAVIYVVVAFRIVNYFISNKKEMLDEK